MSGAAISQVDIRPYEGLVKVTARRFSKMADFELEDMEQELRLKAAEALVSYDPTRTKMTVGAWVFGCLWRRRIDLCRTHLRKMNHGVTVGYIEDYRDSKNHQGGDGLGVGGSNDYFGTNKFDGRYFHVGKDEVYGRIEEGLFVVPACLTDLELKVMLLLTLDMSRTEIAMRLGISRSESFAAVERLQEIFSEWDPRRRANDSATVQVDSIDIPLAA